MPTILLSNPLGADDAERIGLPDVRQYSVGELINVDDFVSYTLIRTGYGTAVGYVTDILIVGTGTPPSNIGADGQWYLDTYSEVLWGPKVSGSWPTDPIRPDRGVAHLAIDGSGHLQVTYSTGTVVDLGYIIGPANVLTAGTVTTLAPGQPATATITTTGAGQQELDLSIPQGAKGDQGDKGDKGDTGAQGPTGATPVLPDATPTVKGVVQLAGDLGGTADLPTVPGLTGKVDTSAVGVANGVASLDNGGKVPLAQIPSGIAGGSGSDQGTISVEGADGSVEFAVDITSNWGITDAGDVYYDSAGAVTAEAGLLIPDPDRNGFAIFRPGGPWPTEDDRVAALIGQAANGGVPASAVRAALDARYSYYWGTGATFPTSVLLKPGDTYRHTDWGLHFYTGAAWRQRGPHEVTAAGRAALPTTGLYAGYLVYETDTGYTWQWSAGGWVFALGADAVRTLTPAVNWAAYVDAVAQWSGVQAWRRNGVVTVSGAVQATAATAARAAVATMPTGWAPPSQAQSGNGFLVSTDGLLRNAAARASGYIDSFTITYTQ